MRSYWVYDPGTGIFIQNEFTHELRCGSVAVTSKYGVSDTTAEIGSGACLVAAFIDFDPEKREIGRRYFDGAMGGCPNTGEGKGERYRVVNNRLILIHKQEFRVAAVVDKASAALHRDGMGPDRRDHACYQGSTV